MDSTSAAHRLWYPNFRPWPWAEDPSSEKEFTRERVALLGCTLIVPYPPPTRKPKGQPFQVGLLLPVQQPGGIRVERAMGIENVERPLLGSPTISPRS